MCVQVGASLHAKCLSPARRNRRSKRLAEDWTQLLDAAQQADRDPAQALQDLSIQPYSEAQPQPVQVSLAYICVIA